MAYKLHAYPFGYEADIYTYTVIHGLRANRTGIVDTVRRNQAWPVDINAVSRTASHETEADTF